VRLFVFSKGRFASLEENETGTGVAMKTEQPKPATIYACPMHPEVQKDQPGKCPKCQMQLVPSK
jgi:hypothetical protein